MWKIGVTIKIRNSCVNNSVEALILFNVGHQGGRGWWRPVWGREGLHYAALLQGSLVSAGFHCGILIFGISCYSMKVSLMVSKSNFQLSGRKSFSRK